MKTVIIKTDEKNKQEKNGYEVLYRKEGRESEDSYDIAGRDEGL